jgi:hypothetical protein
VAPIKRQTNRTTPPPRAFGAYEYSTRKRLRFFNAYDERFPAEKLTSIAQDSQLVTEWSVIKQHCFHAIIDLTRLGCGGWIWRIWPFV